MEKKNYMVPGITVTKVVLQHLAAFTGKGEQEDDPKVEGDPDMSEEGGRSRRTYNVWEEEQEQEEF